MKMGDEIESVVMRNVDASQRTYSDGSPLVSSGISGGSIGSVQSAEPSPQVEDGGFKCNVCKKVLKTKKGFQNHTFLHNITEVNLRKPNVDMVLPKVGSLVHSIVQEMSFEPNMSEDKRTVLEHLQICDESNADWVEFCKKVSTPILDAILKKTKLLPTNQFEEVLSTVNKYMCGEDNMSQLHSALAVCLPYELKESVCLRNVIFRITFKLSEEIQLVVLKEMNTHYKSAATSKAASPQSTFASENDKMSFKNHILNLMRTYFVKSYRINTPIYRARCNCLKKRIFETNDEDFITTEMILDPLTWQEEKIKLSDVAFDFFAEVEGVIKLSLQDKSESLRERVLDRIVQDRHIGVLNLWHTITVNFFSEADLLLFMKEMILMTVDLSTLLEEKKIKLLAEDQKKLQKFALRDSLKRN